MSAQAWGLLALFLLVLLVLSWPLGIWLWRISTGRLPQWMLRLEAPLYRLAGTSANKSMHWAHYALAVLAFNTLGALVVYALQRLQFVLPLNPAGMAAMSPDSAFNTAVSFVTNTNWQGYAGETTMSYLTQMLALAVQNFFSAATAMAVVFALFRGFAARSTGVIGNFWVDVTRSVEAVKAGTVVSVTALVALLVCLIPTTIGGLLSAVGVAGMSRMMQANVIATSGRAVEAAGDVDVLLLDKTGTITHGNRQASMFLPAPGVGEARLARAALLASLADETPEGRSIAELARRQKVDDAAVEGALFLPFTAQTRMSGVDVPVQGATLAIRKGAVDAVRKHIQALGGSMPAEVLRASDDIARRGSTPLAVCEGKVVLGLVELKDIVKAGIKERFGELRRMGIKTVMITGDNKLTAAAIAAEAGVDDFLAEATPEEKLRLIRQYQAEGRLVAMTGDGTNDAPALAQADVAVAMNSGTQAAKEAANMVDLDSNPTKLLEVVETGKALLMTRGSLTTFSIANDVAKYFAILPAIFVTTYPRLSALNVMRLASPSSAILSAVIFNALIIVFLIPLALKGVQYRAIGAAALLRRNLLIYGLGGLVVPFIGIKAIDLVLASVGLV